MSELSILIIEDDLKQAEEIKEAMRWYLHPQDSAYYVAGTLLEVIKRLQSAHYDVAMVDFDLNEKGDWRMDAIETAFRINNYQPSCLKIGLSFSGIHYVIQAKDPFNLMEIYPIILERTRFLRGGYRELIREELGKRGMH